MQTIKTGTLVLLAFLATAASVEAESPSMMPRDQGQGGMQNDPGRRPPPQGGEQRQNPPGQSGQPGERGMGQGPGGGQPPHGPPPEAIAACKGKSSGAACSFTGRQNQPLTGTCFAPPAGGPGQMGGQQGAGMGAASHPLACRPAQGGGRGPGS